MPQGLESNGKASPMGYINRERNRGKFKDELRILINKYSMECSSSTPDYILTDYLMDCLESFEKATIVRDTWYGIIGVSSR